jgi:phospholipid/cholesterol/gamma-HCH transport system permease protein
MGFRDRASGASGGAGIAVEKAVADTLLVRVWGRWTLDQQPWDLEALDRGLASAPCARRATVDARGLDAWDSTLPAFLRSLLKACARRQIAVDLSGIPEGARRLVSLAPERDQGPRISSRKSFLARVGEGVSALCSQLRGLLTFAGEVVVSGSRAALGKASFQVSDLLLFAQQAGASAVPIVSLISVLVGLILGFVGAAQLRIFGAEMYVADLVGIAMVREMGAMMTGIIMAGRTGAAYAAQLGTMAINEELDALKTFGIDPVEFLVLPRMIALSLMLPLLCVYADLLGLVGGALVGVGSFDISFGQYADRTLGALSLQHFAVGLIKSSVYGVIVAGSGCLRGLRCGRSAAAVGEATTSAVVTAIVWIVVACAVTTVVFHVLEF